jgi:pheromone shutdown-related protein TraB
MKSSDNISIIGTSHISIQSINEVKKFIETKKPDIIALELDRQRLIALLSKKRQSPNIFKMGVKAFLINVFGAYLQKKLGKIVGVAPGSEMKTAVKLAKKHKLKIAVIDQNIKITLRKLAKSFTWREKLRFLKDLITSPFNKQKRKLAKSLDLRKVPPKKIIKKLMKTLKKDYPNVHNVLVDERNKIMANNLKVLMHFNPGKKILAIVGAGHEEGLKKLVK